MNGLGMNRNDEWYVRERLRALAETSPREADPWVEQSVLARWQERKGRRNKRTFLTVVAACVPLAVGVYWGAEHYRTSPREAQVTLDPRAAGFVLLPYSQSGVPMEQPVVVRLSIPVSQLSSMGITALPNGRNTVQADVLVAQDGVPRAIRLVQSSLDSGGE